MPVMVIWDNKEKTIIRQIYSGDTSHQDYIQAVDEFAALASSVSHIVHSIMDRREIESAPSVNISGLRYGNQHMPANVGLRVVVKPGLFTQIMVDVGKRIAPNLVQQVYFVDTLEEAYAIIAEAKEARSS